jgi:hypothetical protein
VRGRVAYALSDGFTVGANLSYDHAYSTRFSADVRYRFGSSKGSDSEVRRIAKQYPVIQALTQAPSERNVRVHDDILDSIINIFKPGPKEFQPPSSAGPRLRLNIGGRR